MSTSVPRQPEGAKPKPRPKCHEAAPDEVVAIQLQHLTGIARLNCLALTRLGFGATELTAEMTVDTGAMLHYLAYLLIA